MAVLGSLSLPLKTGLMRPASTATFTTATTRSTSSALMTSQSSPGHGSSDQSSLSVRTLQAYIYQSERTIFTTLTLNATYSSPRTMPQCLSHLLNSSMHFMQDCISHPLVSTISRCNEFGSLQLTCFHSATFYQRV